MDELSEMEMRILTELTEDWETIGTIANTVTMRTGHDEELAEIKAALENLVRTDLVRIVFPPAVGADPAELPMEDSLKLVADLERHLKFDPKTDHWAQPLKPWTEISITDAGLDKVGPILDERPWRWWLQEK